MMKYGLPQSTIGAQAFGWSSVVRRLPELREHRMFSAQAFIQLHDIIKPALGEAIRQEARLVLFRKQSDTATRSLGAREVEMSEPKGGIPAPLLAHLHLALLPLARALTGRMLVPAHAWYNFYLNNDRLRLHVDSQGSELVFLSTALGEVGPLHLHPELRGK